MRRDMENPQKIRAIAEHYKYKFEQHQESIGLLIFNKENVQINVYYTRMTVGTSLAHPKRGKTQLFRKHVTLEELEKIFKNPRIHTRGGYYTK